MTYGPIKGNGNRVDETAAEHLETRALRASAKARTGLAELFSLISKLALHEQEEVRLSMREGLRRAAAENGADLAKTKTWAISHPVESQLAMIWETTDWSASRIKCHEPEARRKQLLKIAQVSHQVWKAHRCAADCVAELLSRDGLRATQLWCRLNSI